jgi:hypothetical protein
MRTALEKSAALQKETIKLETIEGLRHALDRNYHRLLDAARADWERLFASKDSADACVSVRVTVGDSQPEAQSVRGSGFLKASRPSHAKQRRSLPRFAH